MRYLETRGTLNQVFPLFLANTLFGDGNFDTLSRFAQDTRERLSAFTSDTQGEFNFASGPIGHRVLIGVDNQIVGFNQQFAQSAQFAGSPFSAPDISVFNPTYGYSILDPLNDPTSLINQTTHQTLEQTGLYGQDQMKIGRLTVVGGLRFDNAQSNTNTLDLAAGARDAVRQTDRAATGRVGAIYDFDSGIAPYAAYATSFTPNVGTTSAFAALKPTTGELYETGVKFQPRGLKAFFQASCSILPRKMC